MFTKKDRKIANLRAMVANRDRTIIRLKFQVLEEIAKNEELKEMYVRNDKEHQKANEVLRNKIKDLENNLDFLINNTTIEKKRT